MHLQHCHLGTYPQFALRLVATALMRHCHLVTSLLQNTLPAGIMLLFMYPSSVVFLDICTAASHMCTSL